MSRRHARRRVRSDSPPAHYAHQSCEVLTLGAQQCLVNVKSLALLALGFHDLTAFRTQLRD